MPEYIATAMVEDADGVLVQMPVERRTWLGSRPTNADFGTWVQEQAANVEGGYTLVVRLEAM